MPFSDALILGIVQGLTEFLPVSSTGHLILAREYLSLPLSGGLAYDAVLHLATAAAVLIYFRKDFLALAKTLLGYASGSVPVPENSRLFLALLIGTVPAVALGLLFEDTIESPFRSPVLVAYALIAGSAIFLAAEYVLARRDASAYGSIAPSWKNALVIGLFQAIALIPGMSRSGMTISGGLFTGFSREEATRFAFLLSFPVILGAGGLKLFELLSTPEEGAVLVILTGAIAAFVAGIAAIHALLLFVRRYSVIPLVIYRVLLVVVVLVFLSESVFKNGKAESAAQKRA